MRERAGLAWGIYQKLPEEMAADAAAGCAAGFQAIKLKVGRRLEEDLAAVTAVARAVTVPLRLDANMAWPSTAEAARAMRTLAGAAQVAWFEQPLGKRNLEGLRALRQQTGLPVMADERVYVASEEGVTSVYKGRARVRAPGRERPRRVHAQLSGDPQ